MDIRHILDKLCLSVPLRIKREVWTVRVQEGKPVWERKV